MRRHAPPQLEPTAERATVTRHAGASRAPALGAGEQMPAAVRRDQAASLGVDPGQVWIHTDARSSRTADLLGARAFAVGNHVAFAAGQYQPNDHAGRQLLRHELTHVVGTGRSPVAGPPLVLRQRRVVALPADVDRVVELLQASEREVDALLARVAALPGPNGELLGHSRTLQAQEHFTRAELQAVLLLRRSHQPAAQGGRPITLADLSTIENLDGAVQRYTELYQPPGATGVSRDVVGVRLVQLERGVRLVALVSAKIADLTAPPATGAAAEPPAIVAAKRKLSALYLDLLTQGQTEAFTNLAFLETYYADPQRLLAYAASDWIRPQLDGLNESLSWVMASDPLLQEARTALYGHRDRLRLFVERVGAMPASLAHAVVPPPAAEVRLAIADFSALGASVGAIRLWDQLAWLQEKLNRSLYTGTHLVGSDERPGWLDEMNRMRGELRGELAHPGRDGLEARFHGWQDALVRLYGQIVPAIHRDELVAHVVSQIPLMFVTMGVTGAVAEVVEGIVGGSRLLIAAAEAAVMTGISVLMRLPSQTPTISAVAFEFAQNFAFAYIGRLVMGLGGPPEQLSAARRLLLTASAPVAISAVQTAAQIIEHKVRSEGGETEVTELFTVNLVTNAIGLLIGAALRPASGGPSDLTAQTPQAVAERLGINQADLAEYLAFADRAQQVQSRFRDLARQAGGTPTGPELEAWRDSALRLLEDLELHMPRLARSLRLPLDPEAVVAGIRAVRTELMSARSRSVGEVLALPEYTDGLQATADPTTWVVRRNAPQEPLARLRRSMARRHEVVDLPAGIGWKVMSGPRIVFQVLLEAGGTAAALPPSLDALVENDPLAADGLRAVRNTPLQLERVTQASLGPDGPARVLDLLRTAGQLARVRTADAARPGQEGLTDAFSGSSADQAAVAAATQSPEAAYGLRRLSMRFGPSRRTALARIIEAVRPDQMVAFLTVVGDPALSAQPPEFYRALGRNPAAIELAQRFGGAVLLRVANLQSGTSAGMRLARAGVDIERVLRGLDAASLQGDTAVEQLRASIAGLRSNATFRALDRLVGPRPRPQSVVEAVRTDPNWSTYRAQIDAYARDHPVSQRTGEPRRGLTAEQRDLWAALLQTVERARAGEFSQFTPTQREQMLLDFDAVADYSEMDQSWTNARRGQLNEALAHGTAPLRPGTAWRNGQVVRGAVPRGSTILDEAVPPVRPEEIADGSVVTTPRLWIEHKDVTMDLGADPADDVVSRQGLTDATNHLRDARGDLTNLPPGHTIAIAYARWPGRATVQAMARILYAEQRIVEVRFRGVVVPR